MRQPLVSIVMPCYNYARFLPEALASIQAQTFTDFEVVIVDDGSTDETPEILAQVKDPRFRIFRQQNAGSSAARNAGRANTRGAFLTFLDADDLWRPTYLERHMAVFEAEPGLDFCFANMVRTQNGKVLQTQFDLVPRLREIPTRASSVPGAWVVEGDTFTALTPAPDPPGWLQASVFRQSAIARAHSKAGVPNAEDLYLILQAYACARKSAFIDEVLVEIRRHGANSYRNNDTIREAVIKVLHLVHRDIPLSAEHRAVLSRRIGAEHCRRGWRYFWDGAPAAASQHYMEALKWPGSRITALWHLAAIPLVPLLPRKQSGFVDHPAEPEPATQS